MIIQCERIWLFEWSQTDPFIFEKIDGVTTTMDSVNDRRIQLLDIEKAIFYVDTVLKGGLQRTLKEGGEDFMPITSNGKLTYDYTLAFNVPLDSINNIEQLVGREFSIICMRRDLSMFAIFARFVIPSISIDNEKQQRVTFKSGNGNYPIFELDSLNVTEVVNIIGEQPPIYPIETFGLDYELDFILE